MNFEINEITSFSVFKNIDIDTIIENINISLKRFFEGKVKCEKISKNQIDSNIKHSRLGNHNYFSFVYCNKNKKIIYIDNTGESYYSLIWNICTDNDVEGVHLKISSQTCEYPGYMMHYFNKMKERSILCYKEDKWVFFDKGEIQSFENTTYYSNKQKKKRFNKDIIVEYCKALDFNIEDDDFWEPVGDVYKFTRLP